MHNWLFLVWIHISSVFIDLAQPDQHKKTFSPLIDLTLLHALGATLESSTGHTLTGSQAPTAPLTQRVTNVPLFL